MFGFSKKNKRGGIDHTQHNATASMDNIINGMTPPPQSDVQVNHVMPSAPSPAPAAPPCHSGPPSSVPTDALDAPILDPPTRDLHNSRESNVRSLLEWLRFDDVALKFDGVPIIDLSCPDRDLVNREIAEACRDGGCFQAMLMGQGDGHGYHVAMNYYPPWTETGFPRGLLQGQTDPNAFTIHLLDQESPAHMQTFRQG